MAKPMLIIVHGMGQHTADSFKTEVIEGFKWAFNLYDDFAGKSPEKFVDIVPVAYNKFFDDFRQKMANEAKSISEHLEDLTGIDEMLEEALIELISFQASLGEDKFINTHWLDVFLYRFTTLGERVRIELGREVSHAVGSVFGGASRVHILGHSMGTALVHDCLAKLYNDNYKFGDLDNLSIKSHKLGSVHMVANTSRALQSFVNVEDSIVKPGPNGCCRYYREYRHSLDPITWPKSFNPTDNGGWVSIEDWYFKRYELVRLTSVTNEHGNTHNVRHYLANPNVHRQLFKRVLGIKLTDEQITEGTLNYAEQTLAEVAKDLAESFEALKSMDLESIGGLIKSASAARDFVENLGGQYEL